MFGWTILPDFLVTVLAAWLGAGVVARAPRDYVTRPFALLTALLALWGAARVIAGLSGDATVREIGRAGEAGAAGLLPAALLHIAVALTAGRRWRRHQRALVGAAYAIGLAVSLNNLVNRDRPIGLNPPHLALGGLSGEALGALWLGVRATILALAVWTAWRAWRRAGPGGLRRGRFAIVLAAVASGAASGIATILLANLRGPVWLGALAIAASLGLLAYGVFVQRVFLATRVARRSLYYSLGTGLLAAAYVAALLGAERLARRALAIDTPLVTALALVLTIALFDPARQRARALLDRRAGRSRDERAYQRLLRFLGEELLTAQRPEAAIGPALERLRAALGCDGAAVLAPDGRALAVSGSDVVAAPGGGLETPLRAGDRSFGLLRCGPKRSGAAYTREEIDLLGNAAAFVAASLRLAEHQAGQAAALDALAEERAALHAREAALVAALAEAEPAADDRALRVYALGPLRVERGGERIRQWGGAKAGTRQAEALFAFLFDRAERGVAKDEALEVIWPDVPLDKADLAFHRTLGGLRRTLEPHLARAADSTAIVYHNDRYRLDPAIVGWSDVAAFQERIAAAGAAPDPAAALATLEEARALYRGEYLDDCPFYGDSEWVEERRALLRGRYVDLLLALGERYEAQGDRPSAAACFREALQVAGDDCPRADAGLARLGVAV